MRREIVESMDWTCTSQRVRAGKPSSITVLDRDWIVAPIKRLRNGERVDRAAPKICTCMKDEEPVLKSTCTLVRDLTMLDSDGSFPEIPPPHHPPEDHSGMFDTTMDSVESDMSLEDNELYQMLTRME